MKPLHWLARIITRRASGKDTRGVAGRRRARLRLEPLEDRSMMAGFVAVGTDAGVPATVRMFSDRDDNGTFETLAPGTLTDAYEFAPYAAFEGGVRVALGDFDGDGNDELVTAAGPGGGPHVVIWDLNSDGTIGGALDSFFAYGTFSGGVFVAAGDLDGDGRDELVTGADAGGGPHVRIFSDTDTDGQVSDNQTDQFFAFGTFTGGVRVAVGDTNNAGGDELIVAAGPGGGPHVIVYTDSDNDRAVSDHALVESFYAYALEVSGGVYVAAGRIEGAGGAGGEVVTGAGAGGGPHVKVFTDTDADGTVSDNAVFDETQAYSTSFSGGVRVAVGDADNSGTLAEVITAPGPGGGPHVKIFDDSADAGSLITDNPLEHEFLAYAASFTKGIFVAFGKVREETFALTATPQAIADDSTLTSTIVVPASAGVIRDLDIVLSIFHGFDADLDVTLTHLPSGTSLTLFTDVGSTDEGFLVRLNDESATDIGTADNPTDGAISGNFNPEGAATLSDFDDIDASGEWELTIVDDNATDSGTLFSWVLHVTY